eukprot:TRINITY_DN60025_c0_g1_i1.p1 TRINITY_DN60025_c0_g1~~TRINITY_DN60025_c0_g1_i1.p1  ORF type:complete len:440 (+),score=137.86 TRINITY_DN60025_c0_g1_i1:163-1320(+)
MWSTQGTQLMQHAKPVVLHGFSTTCLEYFLRGVGMKCWNTYDWNHPERVATTPDADVLNATTAVLSMAKADGVVPAIRVPLTAAYWLDVETTQWAANRAKYPALAAQYRSLVSSLVDSFTANGIVVILDLHWNDDVSEQQPMALKQAPSGGAPTANAVTFWANMSATFGKNEMVWYELYNEPHISDINAYIHGDGTYAGMLEMYAAVRKNAPNGVCVIAGAEDYAYGSDSLIQLHKAAPALSNVVWNFHPYMGPNQAGDPKKNAQGFDQLAAAVMSGAPRPVVLTEFGQSCCAADGACFAYDGEWGGKPMGYVEAIITIAFNRGISWMPWAWRPQAATSNCEAGQAAGNDINGEAGDRLQLTKNTGGKGADFAQLLPRYFPKNHL